jgi:hypothetical protein
MKAPTSSLRWQVPLALAALWLLAISLSIGNALSIRHADLSQRLDREAREYAAHLVRMAAAADLADARFAQEFAHAATAPELRTLAVIDRNGLVLRGQHRAWAGRPASGLLDGWDAAIAERALRSDEPQLASTPEGRLVLAQRVDLGGGADGLRGRTPAVVWLTLDPRPLREALTAQVLRGRLPEVAAIALLLVLLGVWLHRSVVRAAGRADAGG